MSEMPTCPQCGLAASSDFALAVHECVDDSMTPQRPAAPTTEAGKRVDGLLAVMHILTLPTPEWPDVRRAILAIEAEARQQGAREERALVDRLAHAYEAALRYLDNEWPIPGLAAGSRVAGSEVLNEWRAARALLAEPPADEASES